MDKAQITSYWQDLPWSEIRLKAHKHLPKFIFIVLVILITQTLAELTWTFFTDEQETALSNIKPQAIPDKTAVASSSLKDVSTYHIF